MEEVERKWFLLSRTTWINAILLAVVPMILKADDMTEVARVLNVDPIRELLVSLHPAFNIGLRLISWGAVSRREKKSKPWFFSKTVIVNLLIIVFAAWLGFQMLDADASLKVPLVLIAVAIINIYLRVNYTERRLTLLPGIFGRIM